MKLTKASESCWVVTSVEGTHDTRRWPGGLITQEVRLKSLSERWQRRFKVNESRRERDAETKYEDRYMLLN
jgi:hypothetical protein